MVSMARLIISSCTTLGLHSRTVAATGAFVIHTGSTNNAIMYRSTNAHMINTHMPFLRHWSSTRTTSSTLGSKSKTEEMEQPLQMENIYMEWTLEDDQKLFEHFNEPLPTLAAKLGRGLRGVEGRISKLKDVNSMAYQRLFVGEHGQKSQSQSQSEGGSSTNDSDNKLTPASEVMKRIKWDHGLNPDDFTLDYFDRVEDKVLSCSFGAKNQSVKGKEEMFVFAIPEHRIMGLKYKGRTVWDKQKRLDRVFGSMNGNGETIDKVMQTYDEWEQRQADIDAHNKQRQRDMAFKLKDVLGDHLFASLKDISSTLQDKSKADKMEPQDLDDYVQDALILFRKGRAVVATVDGSPNASMNMPQNDVEALNLFSDLVALLPDDGLRERILEQIYNQVNVLEPTRNRNDNQQLPDLDEDSLSETFVKGSGAGGQKVNKTANKVVLVHEPTQIRVECQDTRSLQQNRKIARKRLKLKLDEYINGSQSKTQVKVAKKVSKKQKTKARNKARQRKKQEAKDATSNE